MMRANMLRCWERPAPQIGTLLRLPSTENLHQINTQWNNSAIYKQVLAVWFLSGWYSIRPPRPPGPPPPPPPQPLVFAASSYLGDPGFNFTSGDLLLRNFFLLLSHSIISILKQITIASYHNLLNYRLIQSQAMKRH
jgi:hypothetical protein